MKSIYEDYPISNAYKYGWDVQVKFNEYPDTFTCELVNLWDSKPDCKIGHFGYNFYYRTPYGMQGKKYKSWSTLVKSIIKVGKKHGLNASKVIVNIGVGTTKTNITVVNVIFTILFIT